MPLLLLLLLSGPGARAQQLLEDGGFLAQPPAGVDALDAFRVTGVDVPDFPGPSAALQLSEQLGGSVRDAPHSVSQSTPRSAQQRA